MVWADRSALDHSARPAQSITALRFFDLEPSNQSSASASTACRATGAASRASIAIEKRASSALQPDIDDADESQKWHRGGAVMFPAYSLIGVPVPCDVPLDGLQAWSLRPHDFFALIMRFAMNLSR